jgi:DNA repair protein RecO (recombination protein O)
MATRTPRSGAALTGYILHRYDWSESSLILDVFTREQGRLAVAAKGAKRPYSQLRAVLLPFQRVTLSLGRAPGAEGTAEIHNLRAAEWAGGPPMLTGAALFSGFYLNELLLKLVARQDPHAALFDAYAHTLGRLAEGSERDAEAALRAFELMLLREIGVLPDLSVATATQQPLESADRYALHPEAGVAPAHEEEPALAGAVLVGLQAALEHGDPAAVQQAASRSLADLKGILRSQLHYHLGSSVLRTRQVMVEAQGMDR